MTSRKYPRLKEVDDVLGGASAWENVDSTEGILNTFYLVIIKCKDVYS